MRFNEYVRGGVDVLYKKLIEGAREPEDFVNRLYDFIDEFQERFNSEFDGEAALKCAWPKQKRTVWERISVRKPWKSC